MAIKITLNVKLDEEVGGPADAMQQALYALQTEGRLSIGSFQIIYVVADESGAELLEEAVEDALEGRDYCIIATVDRKYAKRDLRRRRLEPGPTPIEREIDRYSDGKLDEITADAVRPRRVG